MSTFIADFFILCFSIGIVLVGFFVLKLEHSSKEKDEEKRDKIQKK